MMKSISTWKQELTKGAHAARLAALYCCTPDETPLLLAGGQVIKVDDAQVVALALHAQLVQAVGECAKRRL